jgi:histidine triad (HIT) family protein
LIEAIEEDTNKIHEAADVFYHLLMYLEANDVKIEEVMSGIRKKKKMSYDDNNIFAKILRGEIPCNKIYEDDFVLSFHDINPQKKIHALVIPKGKYVDLDDFSLNASSEEMVGLIKGINIVAKKLGISTEVGKGYRALANISDDGGQEVPHLHFHLFGGEKVGKMVE